MIERIIKYPFLTILGLLGLLSIISFTTGIWHHWVTYPRFEKEVHAIAKLGKKPTAQINLNTYRGVMHVQNCTI